MNLVDIYLSITMILGAVIIIGVLILIVLEIWNYVINHWLFKNYKRKIVFETIKELQRKYPEP